MSGRAVDIGIGLVALIVLSPVLLAIVLAVTIESPGGPLYRGWRAGRGGRPFRMWKFRTMVLDAERKGPGITAARDSRVTRVGAFLRRTKLDELPQFVNVIVGDMTLVGPRAELPSIVEKYSPEQSKVLSVKPGITGPGQIYYTTEQAETIPDHVPADEYYVEHLLDRKLRIDIDYINRSTAWTDLVVLLQTVRLMLRGFFQNASQGVS